jgi:hypothetical protein
VGDPVENNLPRGRLSSLNRILLRVPVEEDVQFRYFGNPTAIDFAVELDHELHSHSLPSMARMRRFGNGHRGPVRPAGMPPTGVSPNGLPIKPKDLTWDQS